MKLGKWVAVVLGLVAAAAAAPAVAQQKGLYVGGSLGLAQYNTTCENQPVPCDDTDAGFRIFGGYQFSRWVGIEAAYVDMGKVKAEGVDAVLGPVSSEAEPYGFDVTAVVSWPILDWMSLIGRLGAHRMRAEGETTVGGVTSPRPAKTSSGFTYGVGAEFRVAGLGIRAEFQRYDAVGHPVSGEDDIIFYSAGVLWRF
jgi:OmpA-OmpF porin, OOP family